MHLWWPDHSVDSQLFFLDSYDNGQENLVKILEGSFLFVSSFG